jgi:biopolymer transport protein ExbB
VIRRQLKNMGNIRDDNAVGRIVWAAREDEKLDVETLELRLGEAVLEEVPRINRICRCSRSSPRSRRSWVCWVR